MKWGQEDLFPTNPDLADTLGRTDLDFDNFYFWEILIPDFQIPGSWNQVPGYGWLRLRGGTSRRHSRTAEFRTSKELGQHRENPISGNHVWGTTQMDSSQNPYWLCGGQMRARLRDLPNPPNKKFQEKTANKNMPP